MTCDRCYRPLDDPAAHGLGLCPLERRRAHAVRPDSIIGGLVIEHGLCHDDGTPRTYYSQSEITAECARRGLVRWTDCWEESKTKDGRVLSDWERSGEARRRIALAEEKRRDGVRT